MPAIRLSAALMLGLALTACQKQTPPPAPAIKESGAPVAAPPVDDSTKLGQFTVTGTLTRVEDGAYPLSTVHVDVDSKDVQVTFDDSESKMPKDMQLSAMVGKKVVMTYKRFAELSLMDMTMDGKGLMKHEPGEVTSGEASVTGKLEGATELTKSDLPGEITVTDTSGKVFRFPVYISDQAVVDANGKTVTAVYDNSVGDLVISIAPAP